MNLEEQIVVMQAKLAGKEIEFNTGGSEWYEHTTDKFNWVGCTYRIKPASLYSPWEINIRKGYVLLQYEAQKYKVFCLKSHNRVSKDALIINTPFHKLPLEEYNKFLGEYGPAIPKENTNEN